jgi:hypothetical protein
MLPEDLIIARVQTVMRNWPMVNEAWGCVECDALFRYSTNAHCPHCNSESIFDAAKILRRRSFREPPPQQASSLGAASLPLPR